MGDINDQAYINLANAIIETAVNDYRHACKQQRKDKKKGIKRTAIKPKRKRKPGKYYEPSTPLAIKRECLKFFRSDYFKTLTNIDGYELIDRLKKEEKKHDGKRVSKKGLQNRPAHCVGRRKH